MRLKTLLTAGCGLLLATSLCACARPSTRAEPNPLEAPPIDTSVVSSVDQVMSWNYVREGAGDLNANGEIDSVRLAADVERGSSGEPLWEHGHRWAVYATEGIAPTLLYAAFVPNGTVEVGLTDSGSSGAPHVVVAERTPTRLRVMEIAVERDGRARLVSEGNYQLTGWLAEPAPPPRSK